MSFVRVRVTNADLSKIRPSLLKNPQAHSTLEDGTNVSWDVVGRSACSNNRIELLFSFPHASEAERTRIVNHFLKDMLEVSTVTGSRGGEDIRVYGLAQGWSGHADLA